MNTNEQTLQQNINKNVCRALKQLSGELFNPEATTAIDESERESNNYPNPQQNNLETAIEDDKLGRYATNVAINHLFGDLAFFCRDEILQELDIVLYSESTEYENSKAKLLKLHILDGLDYLNYSKNIMKEDTRASLLIEYVQKLKGMLPNSYNEDWKHPDEKFKELWRTAIRNELKILVEIRKFWRVIKRSSIQKGRRLIKSKWVFDINGQDCSRSALLLVVTRKFLEWIFLSPMHQ